MGKTPSNYGPQYAPDDEFKRRARLHQSWYRAERLGLAEFREYGNRLSVKDAVAGKNFYPSTAILAEVERRFGMGDKKLLFDMLASDHVGFNFFVPLRSHAAALALVSQWTQLDVESILDIAIEWSPRPKSKFLDDNTSFDVFISYRARGGAAGAVGIEIKFTEKEYSWGSSERRRMFEAGSRYLGVHEGSGLYAAGSLEQLRTKRLKQLWRNQLLGEAMLLSEHREIAHFTSVLLHPAGNLHFARAAADYGALLVPRSPRRFHAETFEAFIKHCGGHSRSDADRAWIEYLAERYVVP